MLTFDPKNDRAQLGLAHLNLLRKDTVAALSHINQSLELSKNNASAYVMRAEIETRSQNDFAAALADMDEAIKLEPHYAGYFINRAFMKYNLDDYFGAMADYDYAVGLDPASIEAHFNRGLLLAEWARTTRPSVILILCSKAIRATSWLSITAPCSISVRDSTASPLPTMT